MPLPHFTGVLVPLLQKQVVSSVPQQPERNIPMTTHADIFMSYAREDGGKVQPLINLLHAHGYRIWWDHDIDEGDRDKKWLDEIRKAIYQVGCVIVVLSPVSIDKEWVREEAEVARRRHILLPVIIEDIVTFGYSSAIDLRDWNGLSSHPAAHTVVRAVADMLGRPIGTTPSDHAQPADTSQLLIQSVLALRTKLFGPVGEHRPPSSRYQPLLNAAAHMFQRHTGSATTQGAATFSGGTRIYHNIAWSRRRIRSVFKPATNRANEHCARRIRGRLTAEPSSHRQYCAGAVGNKDVRT
jgi:hypothetical protein